jgi:hypothetical protein
MASAALPLLASSRYERCHRKRGNLSRVPATPRDPVAYQRGREEPIASVHHRNARSRSSRNGAEPMRAAPNTKCCRGRVRPTSWRGILPSASDRARYFRPSGSSGGFRPDDLEGVVLAVHDRPSARVFLRSRIHRGSVAWIRAPYAASRDGGESFQRNSFAWGKDS